MLISRNDIERHEAEAEKPLPVAVKTASRNHFSIATASAALDDVIGSLEPNYNVHVPSLGNWSNHDLIAWLLKQTGPADVLITSWTISEVAIRTIIGLIDQGLIRSLKCLFDERIIVNCPQAHQFVSAANVEMKLLKIHAKSIVIQNDDWGISVTTSANATTNRRIEKYVICTDKKIANADQEWIERELKGAKPFEDVKTKRGRT